MRTMRLKTDVGGRGPAGTHFRRKVEKKPDGTEEVTVEAVEPGETCELSDADLAAFDDKFEDAQVAETKKSAAKK